MNVNDIEKHLLNITREFREAAQQELSYETAIRNVYEEAVEAADALEAFLKNTKTDDSIDGNIRLIEEFLKELSDFIYVMVQASDTIPHYAVVDFIPSPTEQLASILVHQFMMKVFGVVIPDEVITAVIDKVHASNMSKAGPDGKFVRNPDTGKILKGSFYVKPNLRDEAELIAADLIAFVKKNLRTAA